MTYSTVSKMTQENKNIALAQFNYINLFNFSSLGRHSHEPI